MPPVRLIGMTELSTKAATAMSGCWRATRREHQPNVGSGGPTSYTDIGKFLPVGAGGPEQDALLKLIGTLLDD
jgi:hypothetical protein